MSESPDSENKTSLRLEPLTGTWMTECSVCGKRWHNHCGSTPCCGGIAYITSYSPEIPPPQKLPFDGIPAGVISTSVSEFERQTAVEMPAIESPTQDSTKWLAWSGCRYPDDTVGDVIAAWPDGTITLDDGISVWNPLRALEFVASGGTLQKP